MGVANACRRRGKVANFETGALAWASIEVVVLYLSSLSEIVLPPGRSSLERETETEEVRLCGMGRADFLV